METIYQLKKASDKKWTITTDQGVLFYSGKTRSEAIVKLLSNVDMEEGILILLDEENKVIKRREYKPKKINLDRPEFLHQRAMRAKEKNLHRIVA